MFVVLLKFSNNRDRAGEFMDGHNEWIGRGFDDGVFLLAGSLLTGSGGSIFAQLYAGGTAGAARRRPVRRA